MRTNQFIWNQWHCSYGTQFFAPIGNSFPSERVVSDSLLESKDISSSESSDVMIDDTHISEHNELVGISDPGESQDICEKKDLDNVPTQNEFNDMCEKTELDHIAVQNGDPCDKVANDNVEHSKTHEMDDLDYSQSTEDDDNALVSMLVSDWCCFIICTM